MQIKLLYHPHSDFLCRKINYVELLFFFSIKIMKAYKQFIIEVGKLLGLDADMEKRAEEIIEFEKKLAKVGN